jgi:tRNA modification GTPase
MSTFASVMTSKGTGAISTIQLFGDSAGKIIKKIFKPTGNKAVTLKSGNIYVGTLSDGKQDIDQVTIGCEGPNNFAINCHGNPLIVSDIMKLLVRNKVQLVNAEKLLVKIFQAQKQLNTIAIEAEIEAAKALTIEGTKIINNQVEKGLAKIVSGWFEKKDSIRLSEIKTTGARIFRDSKTAKLIIFGCKAVIVGPPNSGKSTLLNCLAGKEKAIVTNIKGTTRDWVSARCRLGPLSVEFIDTAGLNEALSEPALSETDKIAQLKSIQLLEKADLTLVVLDNSQYLPQLESNLIQKIAGKKVLTVLNKSDLPAKLEKDKLPLNLDQTIMISAKNGTGIEALSQKILDITGTGDFDLSTPVCFTDRQKGLLENLVKSKMPQQAKEIVKKLYNENIDL